LREVRRLAAVTRNLGGNKILRVGKPSNFVQIVVSMLQVAHVEDQQSLKYQLLLFLLTAMELGGRENVLQFVRAGGARVLIPMMAQALHNVSLTVLCSVTGPSFASFRSYPSFSYFLLAFRLGVLLEAGKVCGVMGHNKGQQSRSKAKPK
jgi:hypothetical protein